MMVELQTERLRLRAWTVEDAAVLRKLWSERDPRTPPHRRIDAQGHPTVGELESSILEGRYDGLMALERRAERDVIGYCGLIMSGGSVADEPEIAFELLRRARGQGYAAEAATAIVALARTLGHARLWATVWDWNIESRRLLARLGFIETDRTEVDPNRGTTLFTVLDL